MVTYSHADIIAREIRLRNVVKTIAEDAHSGPERDLHDQIEAELIRRRWYYVHSRMDKRSTQNKGVPDFIIAAPNGRTIWMEVKTKSGKLDENQTITKHVLTALLHEHCVVRSMAEVITELNRVSETFIP